MQVEFLNQALTMITRRRDVWDISFAEQLAVSAVSSYSALQDLYVQHPAEKPSVINDQMKIR